MATTSVPVRRRTPRFPTRLIQWWMGFGLCLGLVWGTRIKLEAQIRTPSLVFSQPMMLNPATAGLFHGTVRASFTGLYRRVARNQLPTISGVELDDFAGLSHNAFSLDMPLSNDLLTGGAGLTFSTDKAGPLRLNLAHASLAYQVPLGVKVRYHRLRAGFQVGMIQYSLEEPALYFEDQFRDTGFPGSGQMLTEDVQVRADLGISLLFYRTQKVQGNPEVNYYLGGSIQHLTEPGFAFTGGNESFIPRRYTAIGGLKFRTRTPVDLNVGGVYINQEGLDQWIGGAWLRYVIFRNAILFGEELAALTAGLHVRQGEAIIPFVGVEYARRLVLSVSADIPVAQETLPNTGYGGWQFSLSYQFGGHLDRDNALPLPLY